MRKYHTKLARTLIALSGGLIMSCALATAQESDEGPITDLEEFIAEESLADEGISPLKRDIENVLGGNLTVDEIPRAVTVLTKETIEQFDVRSFEDLSKVSAGTSRPNIFGLPGSPFIRGDLAGVYFGGMLRVFNRNERPTGFGSLDSMNIVKGPAPATLAPTDVGGYVDFIAKSPFYDMQRGEAKITVGSYEHFNAQYDVGAPILLGDTPAAYRVSVTGQLSESYYNDVDNDYISIYGAIKARLSDKLRLYTGAEWFSFKTNENAGWNRLTQNLVDNRQYVIGDVDPNLVSSTFGGTGNVFLTYNFFPDQNAAANGEYDPNLALVVPKDIFEARFSSDPLATGATAVNDPIDGQLIGYKYTPEYFANGNEVFTTTLEGNQVLSDPTDFADSTNVLWFMDWEYYLRDNLIFHAKTFVDYTDAEKLSSYGFANFNETYKIQQKFQFDHTIDSGDTPFILNYGLDFQYTDSEWHVDFFAEPFGRRDISTGEILPQSIIRAGPSNDINGDGEWDLDAGDTSTFTQAAAFLQGQFNVGERLLVIGGVRAEYADWSWNAISNFLAGDAINPEFIVGRTPSSGTVDHYNANLNVSLDIGGGVRAYAAAQEGTIFTPNQVGGLDQGERHWNEAQLLEAGLKGSVLEDRLFFSASVYNWEKTELSSTVAGDAANNFEADGWEFETVYEVNDNLTILANVGDVQVQAVGGIPFGVRPLTEQEYALYAGAIQYDVVTDPDVRYANNPERIKPGYPEMTFSVFAIYELDNGWGFGAGPEYRDSFWADYEHTIRFRDATIWNANLYYKAETWEFMLRFNNFTDEYYHIGNDGSFADNLLTLVGRPFETYATFKVKF